MRLDTLPPRMGCAVGQYRRLGFAERAPYYHKAVPGTLYMEARLAG